MKDPVLIKAEATIVGNREFGDSHFVVENLLRFLSDGRRRKLVIDLTVIDKSDGKKTTPSICIEKSGKFTRLSIR